TTSVREVMLMILQVPGTRKVPFQAGGHFLACPSGDPAVAVSDAAGAAGPHEKGPAPQQPAAFVDHPEASKHIADWLRRYFVAPGQAVELRVLRKDGGVEAGFFGHDHLDALAELGLRRSREAGVKGVYFTLNPLRPEVLDRPVNTLRTA